MAGLLYPPAFAALTHWGGQRRVAALTTLTLVAGLASTVFAPLTAVLNTTLDWRETYLVLAAILVVITMPAHWFRLRLPWTPHTPASVGEHSARTPTPIASSRAFILLGVGRGIFTLVQATAVSDRWGVRGYGRLNGLLSAPVLVAAAIAPFVGSALAELIGGQARAFLVFAVVSGVAAVVALGTNPSSTTAVRP